MFLSVSAAFLSGHCFPAGPRQPIQHSLLFIHSFIVCLLFLKKKISHCIAITDRRTVKVTLKSLSLCIWTKGRLVLVHLSVAVH